MKRNDAGVACRGNTAYTNEYGRITELTAQEIAYFYGIVRRALDATGINISVATYDHEEIEGHEEALGCYYWNDHGDHFITIDNYFVHERYRAECEGWYTIEPETLLACICHELAHIKYKNHTKYHAALAARYVAMTAAEKEDAA